MTKNSLAKLREEEPKDVGELVEQMREDYQVQLAELVISSNARTAKFSAELNISDAASEWHFQRASLFQGHVLDLFKRKLNAMLDFVGFGRVAFEKVFGFESISQLNYYHDLAEQPYNETGMKLTPEGAFDGFTLEGCEDIPATKAWWLALDPTAKHPHGQSRYIGSPKKTWERRQETLNLRDLFVQRFALRGGKAHAPATDYDENGEPIDVFAEIGQAYADVQAGGLMLLPNTRDKDGNYLYDFEEAQLEGFSATPILEVLTAMDSEQLLSFGIPPKTVLEGDAVGSFAMITQQMLILYAVVEEILDQAVESFNAYVVEKGVEMNFDPSLGVNIRIIYQKLTERPDDLAMEIVKQWLTTPQLSPLVLSGAVDLAAVFKSVGLAVSEDFEEKVATLATLLKPPTAPAGSGFAQMSLGLGYPFR